MNDLAKNLAHIMTHRDKLDSEAFSDLMSKILEPFPNIGWELGSSPIDENIDILSLSVGKNRQLANQIENNLNLPIARDDWRIELGIPPRNWELYFELTDDTGEFFNVDASGWYWTATWSDNEAMLTFYLDDPVLECSNSMQNIIDIVAAGELGETNVMRYISHLTFQHLQLVTKNMHPIKSLRQEFYLHYKDCQYASFLMGNQS